MINALEAEIAITDLHATGNFRVLRRLDLDNDPRLPLRSVAGSKFGLCLDTETTGLDAATDRIIELGLVAFEYDQTTARIIRIVGRYSGFEDPGTLLSDVVKQVTGITDAMLTGQVFDDDAVIALARQADLVIAHNALFDRPFMEGRFPVFAERPWACTLQQIDWAKELINSRNLDYLLFRCGYFINAHRALHDAEGVLGLLLERLPITQEPTFQKLLNAAFSTTCRIMAIAAPFDAKERLKARGYRWNDGGNGRPKTWWTELPEDAMTAELAFLATDIYPRGDTKLVQIARIDAWSRYSRRGR